MAVPKTTIALPAISTKPIASLPSLKSPNPLGSFFESRPPLASSIPGLSDKYKTMSVKDFEAALAAPRPGIFGSLSDRQVQKFAFSTAAVTIVSGISLATFSLPTAGVTIVNALLAGGGISLAVFRTFFRHDAIDSLYNYMKNGAPGVFEENKAKKAEANQIAISYLASLAALPGTIGAYLAGLGFGAAVLFGGVGFLAATAINFLRFGGLARWRARKKQDAASLIIQEHRKAAKNVDVLKRTLKAEAEHDPEEHVVFVNKINADLKEYAQKRFEAFTVFKTDYEDRINQSQAACDVAKAALPPAEVRFMQQEINDSIQKLAKITADFDVESSEVIGPLLEAAQQLAARSEMVKLELKFISVAKSTAKSLREFDAAISAATPKESRNDVPAGFFEIVGPNETDGALAVHGDENKVTQTMSLDEYFRNLAKLLIALDR